VVQVTGNAIFIFHPATSFTSGKCLIIHEFRTQVGDINNEWSIYWGRSHRDEDELVGAAKNRLDEDFGFN
jgi:hypothetical protein